MQNTTTDNEEYCKDLIKKWSYGRYLQCGFTGPAEQSRLYPLFALNAELIHVHHAVSEEMIGHIRYAWWSENVASRTKSHPVTCALAQAAWPAEQLETLIDSYRNAYPEMPNETDAILDSMIQLPPKMQKRWEKAGKIITSHRGGHIFLLVKLLFV